MEASAKCLSDREGCWACMWREPTAKDKPTNHTASCSRCPLPDRVGLWGDTAETL